MDDELGLLEIDSRVRAALQTPDDARRRVVARALADKHGTAPRRWRTRFASVAAAAVALILVVGWVQWRRTTGRSAAQSLTVTSAGSMLVIEGRDGRRWIVGPSLRRRSGNYVMVIAE